MTRRDYLIIRLLPVLSVKWKFGFWIACVAGGISHMRAFVLVAKPWKRVAKPWEDWWRVQLNSRLPKFVGFFELCVHQCTRISDWLRIPKRQSNVNLYLRFDMTYVHLLFSVGSLDFLVASLVFMKGTLSCVIRRNLKKKRAVKSCYGKF